MSISQLSNALYELHSSELMLAINSNELGSYEVPYADREGVQHFTTFRLVGSTQQNGFSAHTLLELCKIYLIDTAENEYASEDRKLIIRFVGAACLWLGRFNKKLENESPGYVTGIAEGPGDQSKNCNVL